MLLLSVKGSWVWLFSVHLKAAAVNDCWLTLNYSNDVTVWELQRENDKMITIFLVWELWVAALFLYLQISAACIKLACKCVFAYVCLCVTVNKKQCLSMEPHGANPCQHSQPQLPVAARMLSHDPTLGSKLAKYCAFLSCSFQGKVLLSPISPHKPLNTGASTVNGLQRCEGNIYNYPRFIQSQGLQPLT